MDGYNRRLSDWFNKNKSPDGIPKGVIEAYKKIAEKAIKEGRDKYGTQMERLKRIQEYLRNRKD